MPLYEYQCDVCAQRFEIIQRFSDPTPETCRMCGKGPVRRLMSSPAIQFKGTGWYITDYSQKGKSNSEGSASEQKAEKDSKDSKDSKAPAAASSDSPSSSSSTTETAKPATAAPAPAKSDS